MGTTRRMRSKTVVIGITAFAASNFLAGCAEDDPPDYQAICVDPQTHERLDDDMCDDGDHPRDYDGVSDNGFFWFYLGSMSNRPIPAVGGHYQDDWGTYNGRSITKTHTVIRGGTPRGGGTSVKSYTKSTVKGGGFGGHGVSSS